MLDQATGGRPAGHLLHHPGHDPDPAGARHRRPQGARSRASSRSPGSRSRWSGRALGELNQGQKDYPAAAEALPALGRPPAREPRAAALALPARPRSRTTTRRSPEAIDDLRRGRRRAQLLLAVRPGRGPDPRPGSEPADPARDAEAARRGRAADQGDPGPTTRSSPSATCSKAGSASAGSRPTRPIDAYRKALERGGGQDALEPPGRRSWPRRSATTRSRSSARRTRPLPTGIEQLAAVQAAPDGRQGAAPRSSPEKVVEGDPQGLDTRNWEIEVFQALGKPKEAEAAAQEVDRREADRADPLAPAPDAPGQRQEQGRGGRDRRADPPERQGRPPRAAHGPVLPGRRRPERRPARASRRPSGAGPTTSNVLSAAVTFYEQTGRRDDAEETLRLIRRRDPSNAWATRKLALSLASHRRRPRRLGRGARPGRRRAPPQRRARRPDRPRRPSTPRGPSPAHRPQGDRDPRRAARRAARPARPPRAGRPALLAAGDLAEGPRPRRQGRRGRRRQPRRDPALRQRPARPERHPRGRGAARPARQARPRRPAGRRAEGAGSWPPRGSPRRGPSSWRRRSRGAPTTPEGLAVGREDGPDPGRA